MKGRTEDKINRTLLHRFLWKWRLSGDIIHMSQGELAEGLGVNKFTISRIFKELMESGKIEKINKSRWRVVNPDK